MKKLLSLFQLIRPLNFLITFLVITVGYLISVNSISLFILICASLSGGFTAAAGNIVNDIFDIESDKINHPRRPLACNQISYNSAKSLWFIVTLLSFIFSSLVSLYAFLIVLAIHVLLIFYSFKIKSTVLAGNILISFLTAMAFIYGAYAAGNFKEIIVPALFAFIINFIREIVKDIQDIKGDRIAGMKTFPVKYGVGPSKRIIIIFIIFLLILTFYAFFSEYYDIEFFILMMVIVNPFMLYIIKLFNSGGHLSRISGILKFNMVVGLIAIYLGQ